MVHPSYSCWNGCSGLKTIGGKNFNVGREDSTTGNETKVNTVILLNVITLGQTKSDNIIRIITITDEFYLEIYS